MRLFEKSTIHFNILLLGLYLFYIGNMLYDYIYIGSKWSRVLSIVGLFAFWGGFIKIGRSINGCDKKIKVVYYVLLTVCLCHLIIGLPFYEESISFLLCNPQYMWLFFIPLAFLIPVKFQYVSQLIQWSWLYVLTSLAFSLYYFNDFFYNAEELMASMIGWEAYVVNRPQEPALLLYPITAFAIMFPNFQKKRQIAIVLATVLAVGAGMMAGRRSATAILVALLFVPIFIKYFQFNKKIIVVGTILLLVMINVSYDKIEYAFEETFPVLANRFDKDSRSGVEEDFYKDMDNVTDWVFGRGMNGTYKCTTVASIDRLYRILIETGYLNIILHGGLLMLIPYLILLFYASYKGFFYSNNIFLKGCAIYIFIHILMLYPEGTPKLTLDYFILFLFIRICVSKEWRNYSTEEIEKKCFVK